MVKASLGAAVDAAARELAALAAVEGAGSRDHDDAVLVVTGSLHAVGEALRILPLVAEKEGGGGEEARAL